MGNSRSNVIDVFKGLGILLVILGHAWGVPNILQKLIYSFHMPAFFILSGYFFRVERASEGSFEWLKIEPNAYFFRRCIWR